MKLTIYNGVRVWALHCGPLAQGHLGLQYSLVYYLFMHHVFGEAPASLQDKGPFLSARGLWPAHYLHAACGLHTTCTRPVACTESKRILFSCFSFLATSMELFCPELQVLLSCHITLKLCKCNIEGVE
ncbi:hypothetical protein DUNSADRAFT_1853 [Dunaliella salina]|uniref:Encoded protein n=1 Tax=Dunaliella salina TaxID=3046 RepID=A0ABQ7GWK1_DUNSA|nr:hypothetical protein DUNSADRAFT_1853 [Dunaliella salina]|eukprot:KAF5838986.1 hypothetical protein DUNSADRAFT_1853 [Dunaliella salina]